MLDTQECILSRYSCRAFTGEALRPEELSALGEAALAAPSAMNLQPWRIILLQDKALIEETDARIMDKLRQSDNQAAYERMTGRGGKVFYNAPAVFYIFREETPYSMLDCGIVAQNIALSAQGLGLTGVICGMAGIVLPAFPEERLRFPSGESFLSEGFVFAMGVLVGRPAVKGQAHPRDKSKLLLID